MSQNADSQSLIDQHVTMTTNERHQLNDSSSYDKREVSDRPEVPDADYFFYVTDLISVQESWTNDRAFYPSTITYGLTLVVGLTGNILVIAALLADRKARNVTSSFMISLAMADLLFLLVCVPYEAANKFISYWSGGLILCKITGFVEMLSTLASVLNLTAVSVERYVVIVHPMKSRYWHTARTTYKVIAVVWILALILSAPTLHIMGTSVCVWYNNNGYVTTMSCVDNNGNSDVYRIVFAWYQLLVMFMFPVVVILYCYVVVILVLWRSTREHATMTSMTSYRAPVSTRSAIQHEPLRNAPSSCHNEGRCHGNHYIARTTNRTAVTMPSGDVGETRKQLIKMLMIIVGVFFCCWGPKFILNVLKKHEFGGLQTELAFYVSLVLNLLPYIQSCCNPVIYSFMSTRFRQSLVSACCCKPLYRLGRHHNDVSVAMETGVNRKVRIVAERSTSVACDN